MKKVFVAILLFPTTNTSYSQDLEPFELADSWISKISAMVPTGTEISDREKKKVLIFSLHTGYEHWTLPHTEAVMKILAEKSGDFKVTTSKDIVAFKKENLARYDALILNNNCSIHDRRNLFWDVLKNDGSLTDEQAWDRAAQLEANLLDYVRTGGGLVLLHGAIVMQNTSEAFGKMVGGSFDYHPKQQKIEVKLVDSEHRLVEAFDGEGFEHVDEPYFFDNAYFDYNFRPLLYMEANQLEGKKESVTDTVKYISWIKKYGKGRIFYSSPSHNAQSYENPKLLRYLSDGLQYVVGTIDCDDSPIEK
ncbi:ThuA domain-containing protein [Flavobacteriaceae bacterium TP-CH-4]|uniref:ThuA domain-containing protein n=1 Tax=Pelagihabitans pacificus TaxID=2696054 RepID=A0A967EFB5_9FLAO|nr:ThuA domain-containing protein [Pelagihabitans pacificus]NHF61233.1 ThuA domain-containing protein [Pelagihabitans pacificus]